MSTSLYPIFITLNGAFGAVHVRSDAVLAVLADIDHPAFCDVYTAGGRLQIKEPAADVLVKIAQARVTR